jgi:hypothetical protein
MPGVQVNLGGLTPASRLGGGGDSNFMLDGATSMDPGVNRPATRVSVEAISEVRVATSTYQAEYGRASGLQVNAVSKSGTNRFLGSIYDVERDSKWNSNSQTNILNGDPKPFQDERDYGFSIGGPVGKPGGANKLFFFFTMEMQPRTVGGDVTRYRMPTLLERQGDFSQSTNNLGQPYPYIKDPSKTGACNATSQAACFADGGVVGKIPQSALYAPGMAVLNWYPLPNMSNVPPVRPSTSKRRIPGRISSAISRSFAWTISRSRTCAAASSSSSISSRTIRSRASSRDGMTRAKTTTGSGSRPRTSTGPWTRSRSPSSPGAATITTRKVVPSPAPARTSVETRCLSTTSRTATRPASAGFPTSSRRRRFLVPGTFRL